MVNYLRERVPLHLGGLLSVLRHPEGYLLYVTKQDNGRPSFVAEQPSIGGYNGIGEVVCNRCEAWIPVLVVSIKVYC